MINCTSPPQADSAWQIKQVEHKILEKDNIKIFKKETIKADKNIL